MRKQTGSKINDFKKFSLPVKHQKAIKGGDDGTDNIIVTDIVND